jgi:hypothetical protein
MRRSLRYRPSPSMVVALIALTVALGGTGYAAVTLPAKSVGTKQLKNKAVTTKKLNTGAVKGAKVAADTLTGADVLESSLAKVPSAANADEANHAKNADNATQAANATHATNADNATHAATADSAPYLTDVPSGKTLRGQYEMDFAPGSGQIWGQGFSFVHALPPGTYTAHYINAGATPPAECPGTAANPHAAADHLCIYEVSANKTGTNVLDPSTNTTGRGGRFGFGLWINGPASGNAWARGSWAVTAK